MQRRRVTSTASTAAAGLAAAALLLAGLAAGGTTATAGAAGAAPAPAAAKGQGQLYVVQAVPGKVVDVEVDGEVVREGLRVGKVVGPLDVPAGKREVTLTTDQWSVETSVRVGRGQVRDVVLHRPASRGGDPLVSTYDVPDQPIGPRKARVVLAHTATAPPADVRVDGQTVFRNIANGEFAEADVPSGTRTVSLLPTGSDRGAFLGPLDVDLDARTVTMVYAVGFPQDNSMRVVSHSAGLASDGSVTPSRIETGSSAGLARDLVVVPSGR